MSTKNLSRRLLVLALFFLVFLSFKQNVAAANEAESNGSQETANMLTNRVNTVGNLMDVNDVDFYKFQLPQNGYSTISFQNDYTGNGTHGWEVTLYDSGMNVYASWTYYGDNASEHISDAMGMGAGTYYIRVKCTVNHSAANYRIKYNFTADNSWETEFNNSYDNADQITNGTYCNGNLMNYGDEDLYKIQLPQDGNITVTFQNDYTGNGVNCWKVTFYDAGMNEYATWDYYGNNTSEHTSDTMGVVSGTYYIIVKGSITPSTAHYRIKYNYSANNSWEKEFNNTYSNANQIGIGTYINGNLMNYSDEDFYKFQLTQNGYISLSFQNGFTGDSVHRWRVTLYDSNMNESTNWTFYGDDASEHTTDAIGVKSGTYYLKVEPTTTYSSANYKLRVNNAIVVRNISLSGASNAQVGDTYRITANVTPSDATNKALKWSSSDDYVVEVDQNGNVTCKKAGQAIITATATDGSGCEGKLTITVSDKADGAVKEERSNILKKVSIGKVTAKGKRKVQVKWKKVSNAKKYQIQLSTDKSFKKNLVNKTVKSKSSSATLKSKKYGTVYVRVRAIDAYGKVGKWSKTKKVRVK